MTYVLRARLDICRMENELSGAHACSELKERSFDIESRRPTTFVVNAVMSMANY